MTDNGKYEMLCTLTDEYTKQTKLELFFSRDGTLNLNSHGWNDYQDWDTIYIALTPEEADTLLQALTKAVKGK